MADDSEVRVNWPRQISKLMEDQATLMDGLAQLRQRTTDNESRCEAMFTSVKMLTDHLITKNQAGLSTSSIPCGQGTPQNAQGMTYGKTDYGLMDMSLTMGPPMDVATPRFDVSPVAASTGKRPQDFCQIPTSDPLSNSLQHNAAGPSSTTSPRSDPQQTQHYSTPPYPGPQQIHATQQTTPMSQTQRIHSAQAHQYLQHPTQQQQIHTAQMYPPFMRPHRPHWNATFAGEANENLDAFIAQFEHYATIYNIEDAEMSALFVGSLRGRAANISSQIKPGAPYREIIDLVRQRFAPGSASSWLAGDFSKQMRRKDETPRDYLERLSNLAVQSFPKYNKESLDDRVLEQFLNGQDPRIKLILAGSDVNNLDAAIKKIMQVEDALRSSGAQEAGMFSPYGYAKKARAVSTEDTSQRTQPSVTEDSDDAPYAFPPLNIRWIDHALEVVQLDDNGRFDEDDVMLVLEATVRENSREKGRGICYFCQRKGHAWRKCYQLKSILIQNGMKGDGPFPKDTPAFLAKRNNDKKKEDTKDESK